MSNETYREVYKMLREEQSKHTYFLLAAVGAAIGFAVTQTQNSVISWSQLPLGIAVFSWGMSFFFGCRHIMYVNSNLYANAELINVELGNNPMVGTNPQMIAAASEGIREAFEENSNRSSRFAKLQFYTLLIGAIMFLIWHVTEMILRLHPIIKNVNQ